MKKQWKSVLLLLAALMTAGPGSAPAEAGKDGISCGAWIVYWDFENGLEEAAALDPMPDRLIAFEALFAADESVVLEPEAEIMLREMQERFPADRIWLSVVNDLTLSGGGYSNKDQALLRRLLLTPEGRAAHIRELTELVDRWGLKGLEIDYENIHEDRELWAGYTAFLRDLYDALRERGTSLRACLEWDSLLYTDLPEGPEYCIMCYSLYGWHSGPGPKADRAFLNRVAALYAGRTDYVMALAAGGYDWIGNRVENELTERQAEKVFRARNLKPSRDADSGALRGEYLQNGDRHTVWYADAETLRFWMEVLQEAGFSRFDIFRLGGNRAEEWNEQFPAREINSHEEGDAAP